MRRIIVAVPDDILFATQMAVQIGDINYGRHLANDAVLRLCHETRMRWLKQQDWSELDAGGAGLIMADSAVQYLAQAHHGDDLRIDMGAADVGKSGFTLLYHLIREPDEKSIARVQTRMVCFDYAAQRVCRLPEPLKAVLEAV
ncbi:thioesterase [Neisseria weixii]|uniref:Thioesterase n=1 Tax=Neisseria weixii TaxID=1853276 RepID=A0A3N4N3M2_9NEIS|nr:thioesterase family protein [Neisseria weixii]RPD90812.1 thioesterase [Neisseria weixii]RPD91005.1 thioesterase [Neisseria weixii]